MEKLDTLLKKIRETGSTEQRHENGRLNHARMLRRTCPRSMNW